MSPEEESVRRTHSDWIDAVNAGDPEVLLGLMTDDAVFLNPGREPVGREGFAAEFSSAHRRFRIRCISELVEVVVVGEIAFARSRDELIVAPRDGGQTACFAGDRLTIYRRQPDGRMLTARDAHTLSPVEASRA